MKKLRKIKKICVAGNCYAEILCNSNSDPNCGFTVTFYFNEKPIELGIINKIQGLNPEWKISISCLGSETNSKGDYGNYITIDIPL